MPKKLNILRLQLTVCSNSAPHHNFTLNTNKIYNITVCSFYKPEIKIPSNINLHHGNGKIIEFLFKLKYLLKKNSFDIIHAHTVHVAFLFIFISILFKWHSLNKSMFTVHNSFENYHFRNKLLFFITHWFFNKIVYCSNSSFNSFPEYFTKNKNKNFTIRNGLNIKKLSKSIKKAISLNNKIYKIIVVGRLVEIKQPYIIINAFLKILNNNVELNFIGDGDLKSNLILKNYKNVNFIGKLKREEVYKELYKSDLFISMSVTEGMPIAVLEAMAIGLPVVLSDIKAHREIVKNLNYTNLVPTNSEELLIEEIDRILNMPNNMLNNIRENNQNHIINNFSIDIMLKQYDKIYVELAL